MPKCASTSIEMVITPYCNQLFSSPNICEKHITANTFNEKILTLHKKQYPRKTIESICLIREPIDWLFSWYRYRQRKELADPSHKSHIRYTGNITFDEFANEFTKKEQRKPFANIETQFDFVKTNNNKIGVNTIFSTTEFNQAINYISEKIGRKILIPEENVSPKAKYSLNRKTEEKLRDYMSVDFALYDLVKKFSPFRSDLHNEIFDRTLKEISKA